MPLDRVGNQPLHAISASRKIGTRWHICDKQEAFKIDLILRTYPGCGGPQPLAGKQAVGIPHLGRTVGTGNEDALVITHVEGGLPARLSAEDAHMIGRCTHLSALFRPTPCPHLESMAHDHAMYQPCHAEASVLYAVIRQHLDEFLRAAANRADDAGLPEFIAREFREFLTCGVLAHGFVQVRCGNCALEHLVPFSCKPAVAVSTARRPARAPVVMSPARRPGRSSAPSYRRAMVSGVPGPPTAAV